MPFENQKLKPYLTDADRLDPTSQRNKGYLPTANAATQNAVATATGDLPRAQAIPGTTGYRDLTADPPRPDFGQREGGPVTGPGAMNAPPAGSTSLAHDANMPNGSIRTVYQDSTYPGAVAPTAGLPRAQPPAGNFASFNSMDLGGSGGGGQGGGSFEMFNPGVQQQLNDLSTRANTLLGSRSMVDNWRGRQAAKMRDRMMLSESAMGNTRAAGANARANMLSSQASALRAANEVPLAQMHDYTAQRGQDYQRDTGMANVEAHRYATDVGAASQQEQTRAQLAIHGSDLLRAGAQEQAWREGGGIEGVKAASEAFSGTAERNPVAGRWEANPAGGGVYIAPGQQPKFYTQKQMDAAANLPRLESAAAELEKQKNKK